MSVKDFPGHPSGSPFESDQFQRWLVALRNRQNIDLQQELTSVDSADELLIFDASETGPVKTKKATVANILALVASGDMSYADSRFKVGSFTRDTSVASGDVAITGVGFQPKFLLMMCGENGAQSFSFGFDDGVTKGAMINAGIISAGVWFLNGADSALFYDNAGGTSYTRGRVASFGADGFTYTFDKVGTPTGTITMQYVAFR